MHPERNHHKPEDNKFLSAVIITKNVADTIRPCLEALTRVCDDIVVMDTFSDDGTVEICREMGARVCSCEWMGYSKTKNKGNELARHDWILSIDADEVLSDRLIRSLNDLKPESGTVYALDRLTSYCGKWIRHCGWYPDWKVRVFNRKSVYWQGDFVHETLSVPDSFEVVRLDGKLLHYSYSSPDDHLQRLRKYAKLSAEEQFRKGKKATFVKRWLSPFARFVRTYFVKRGILDGREGLVISLRNAYMVRLRYRVLDELWKKASD